MSKPITTQNHALTPSFSRRGNRKPAAARSETALPTREGKETKSPKVAVIMGSKSDWDVIKNATETLKQFGIAYEARVISAHRTPALATEFAESAESRGLEVIICAAGGAAHLAGVIAAQTLVPVLGVPMAGWALNGMDALLSTVQMPGGIPVGTLAVGKAGAINSALLAVAIMANTRPELREKLREYRKEQTEKIAGEVLE